MHPSQNKIQILQPDPGSPLAGPVPSPVVSPLSCHTSSPALHSAHPRVLAQAVPLLEILPTVTCPLPGAHPKWATPLPPQGSPGETHSFTAVLPFKVSRKSPATLHLAHYLPWAGLTAWGSGWERLE